MVVTCPEELESTSNKPTGVLADIIGSKPVSYAQASKKLWKHIGKEEGERKATDTPLTSTAENMSEVKSFTAAMPMMKNSGGKNKVAMVQLAKFTKKYMKEL